MTGMISSSIKPHEATALLPLALVLTIIAVANLLILIPYIKKHLRSGKAGLVTMFHDGAYAKSVIAMLKRNNSHCLTNPLTVLSILFVSGMPLPRDLPLFAWPDKQSPHW